MEAPIPNAAAPSASSDKQEGGAGKRVRVKPLGEQQPAVEAFETGSGVRLRSHTAAAARDILNACGSHREGGSEGKPLVAGDAVAPFIQRAAASWVLATPNRNHRTTRNFANWTSRLHRRDVEALLAGGGTAADKLVGNFATLYEKRFKSPYSISAEDYSAAAEIVAAARVAEAKHLNGQGQPKWSDGQWVARWRDWHFGVDTMPQKSLNRLRYLVAHRLADMQNQKPGGRPQRPSEVRQTDVDDNRIANI